MKSFLQKIKLICIALVVASTCSCSYMEARAEDLTEVANVNVSAISAGLGVNAGPAIAGFYLTGGIFQNHGNRIKLGLGGIIEERDGGEYWGVGIPLSWSKNYDYQDNIYKKYSPAWGSVGFDLGFLFGIGARVDFVEAVDFVLGIFTIDILSDDEFEDELEESEETSPPE